MSALTAAQNELAEARAASAAAQLAAWQAVQTQRSLSAALQQLAATTDPADRAGAAQLEELQQQVRAADAEAAAAAQQATQAGEAAAAALGKFAQFADPRESIGLFPDSAPLTLLPVRVETRFVGPGTADNASPQLWVRIYPDDCSIDTFEPTLSDTEVANAKLYWQRIWAAGGVEADERAAWRDLVSAHGSGRAGFIVNTYQPVNLADSPQKVHDSDEILVIATQTPLDAAESTAISTYWLAIWLADDDATAQQAAAAALATAVGAARAAALIADYVPVNLSDTPAAPLTKHQVASSVAFVVFPPIRRPSSPPGRRRRRSGSSPSASSCWAIRVASCSWQQSAASSRCRCTPDPIRQRTRTPGSIPSMTACSYQTSCSGSSISSAPSRPEWRSPST